MQVAVTSNAGEIAARLDARVAALRDVRPVLAGIAAEVDRLTGEALSQSRRVDGIPFPDLTDSTKLGRLRRRKAAYKKARGGKKATPEERKAGIREAIAAAKFRPLIDTGRLRASARARVVGSTAVRWSVVDYGVPHITGSKNHRPPVRNFSVFKLVGGTWVIEPRFAADLVARISEHVRKAGAR